MSPLPVPRDMPLPLPAPEPLLVGVLVLFFLMHIVFVNLMVGGTLLGFWYELRGLRDRRYDTLAKVIAGTVTANKSIAVVLGIGPLLAINTLYTVYFYTANALTGTFWISIIPLVTLAFVLTYIHKYLWDWMASMRWLHLVIAGLSCALFLFIPLIFLTNINLMLFPARWADVHGFVSALALPNVFPRYVHFLLACPAMTGLFLVWLFRRKTEPTLAAAGFSRDVLIRIGYRWALWPTMAQFAVGPVTLLTLPKVQAPDSGTVGVFALSVVLTLAVCALIQHELRRPAEIIGRGFGPIVALMVVVVGLMGAGRHMYREAALAPHRALVQERTREYQRQVNEAAREAAGKPAIP